MRVILARTLSSSKSKLLKPLFSLTTISSHSHTNSIPQFHHHPLIPSPSLPLPSFFSSKPTNSLSPITRDGNYDDSTPPATVCPGCGIHIQDSDPKQPGFFTKPSVKDPNYKSTSYLVPLSLEYELSHSLKTGDVVIDNGGVETCENSSMAVEKPVVCARCHSLRHYGKVKDPTVENLLPEFDFDATVGKRLVSASGARSVVLLVVDAVDFDGSFPKKVAKLVSYAIEDNYNSWKLGKSGNVPRLVLVVTKIDLLPTSLSPTRFEHWVRQRAREGGATVVKKVHFVSAVRDWGLKDLVEDVIQMAGARGNVWTVGMQNAGKSTLINAMGRWAGGGGGDAGKKKLTHLTEAPVPGTTLGIVRVEGFLPGQAKLFDTPGLLNPCQITTRLTRDEQKLVHISKELKPRTYRIKEGHSVHIGGLIRLDIEKLSVDSVYVTVWASPYLPLHMGKTENASTMVVDHFGRQLQPPIGKQRVQELGKWVRHEFSISGNSWDSSSMDISAAGVGWFAIGLKGEAVVGVWTYEGVDVVLRNPLIPFRSQNFEVAGFTVSKIVSHADKASNRSKRKSESNRKESDKEGSISDEPLLSVGDTRASSC
ncbi:GTP-binding protein BRASSINAZOLE INSENSITIVE PALE GREEN 2, chloroplastic [Mercurialis annua]|uniref:GTP-binding protein BRASSINAZOLE INSENSITIVE PALE GREEN 2, chloroplastic n=1 Tax=Mercurialis annua TaxID=3986 RepID=UPI00215EC872|nr:GTP-binding protein BRASSINAZOLE INSENSITIVE PALE GREEN 2, chloroplastic [Mercurialis annua]